MTTASMTIYTNIKVSMRRVPSPMHLVTFMLEYHNNPLGRSTAFVFDEYGTTSFALSWDTNETCAKTIHGCIVGAFLRVSREIPA